MSIESIRAALARPMSTPARARLYQRLGEALQECESPAPGERVAVSRLTVAWSLLAVAEWRIRRGQFARAAEDTVDAEVVLAEDVPDGPELRAVREAVATTRLACRPSAPGGRS